MTETLNEGLETIIEGMRSKDYISSQIKRSIKQKRTCYQFEILK